MDYNIAIDDDALNKSIKSMDRSYIILSYRRRCLKRCVRM